jgi:predicted thioesterase
MFDGFQQRRVDVGDVDIHCMVGGSGPGLMHGLFDMQAVWGAAAGQHAIASATTLVTGADLAEALNQSAEDAFPPVYATSRMIGLMELAAARAMRPALSAGELSVGVSLDVTHIAATPIGVEVTAEARCIGQDGKLFVFELTARDRGGEIGRGTHKRAIVAADRLVSGAVRRTSVASGGRLPERA